MLKNKTTRAVVIGAAVFAVVAGVAVTSTANAANQPNGSQGAMYIGSGNTGALVPAGTSSAFTDPNFGYGDPTNVTAPYTCPSDATGVASFVALAGQEYTVANWAGKAFSGFASGTKNISTPDATLNDFAGTGTAAMKTTGGNYSVGIACTINNGSALASTGVYFASIHITAVTGAYTIDQPTAAAAPTPTSTPVGSQPLTLKATTLAAQDGVLSLLAPASSTVLIGNPVLDPTTHLSVSTGKLGNVTVSDGRVVTHPGWNLTTAVSVFTLEGDSTKTIPAAQLGLSPIIVSKPLNSVVTAAGAQIAGSGASTSSFASADNGANVGSTVVDADLKFIAPATATAGTYDSTLTLTLTSK
jgi:hypothetical protein